MIRLKSRMNRNVMGINMVYEDGSWENVMMVLMPPDDDVRANIEFYDTVAKAYKKRMQSWTNHPIR